MPLRYLGGNRVTLLENGEHYFPALLEALDGAVREVFLETYIFAADETGSLVAGALARAAGRGVAVHLLIDGFGAADFAPRFRAMLHAAGVQLLVFRPELLRWRLRRSRLRRMHRKLASIDGRIGFVGGINVIDDVPSPAPAPPRLDYAVRVEGPVVTAVRAAAVRLWTVVSRASFGWRWREPLPQPGLLLHPGPAAARARDPGGRRAALLVRDNIRHRRDIENAYLHLIGRAREEVVIASAYFLPGRRLRRALTAAAARGVRVVLLLQGRAEYLLAYHASRALYANLLDAGVEIFEYTASFLHAKVAVFDRRTASVGSSNIDPFSLLLAREANLFVRDAGFARELRESLERAMRLGAAALPPQQWGRRSPWRRALSWAAYGLARVLMGFAGRQRYG